MAAGLVIAQLRAQMTLQQRLVSAQMSMERDYWQLKHAQTRYRLLFQVSSEALLIAISILIAIGGYYCIIAAMRIGEVSAVVPFRYSRLLFGVTIGVWYFGEVLDRWTLIGSAIVVLSGLYALWREAQLR